MFPTNLRITLCSAHKDESSHERIARGALLHLTSLHDRLLVVRERHREIHCELKIMPSNRRNRVIRVRALAASVMWSP